MSRPAVVVLALLAAAAGAMGASARAQTDGYAPPPLPVLLRLRPDQRGAWRAYRDELAQERSDAEAERHALEGVNAMTTPQRLDWTQAQTARREAEARRAADATRIFYATLLPEQRRRFDVATRTPIPPPPVGTPGLRSPSGAGLPRPLGAFDELAPTDEAVDPPRLSPASGPSRQP